MTVGLFIPCYVDQCYPHVGLATLEVLQQHDVDVDYPTSQTCCGQPMANTGCAEETRPLALKFFETFRDTGTAVVPAPAPLGSPCAQ